MDNSCTVEIKQYLEPVVPRFLANCRSRCERAEKALNEHDFSEVRLIGHHLKGAGGGYGFQAITEFGARIEYAASKGDAEAVRQTLEQLVTYLKNVEVVFV